MCGHPSNSVPLWAGGFAAEIRDDAENLLHVSERDTLSVEP